MWVSSDTAQLIAESPSAAWLASGRGLGEMGERGTEKAEEVTRSSERGAEHHQRREQVHSAREQDELDESPGEQQASKRLFGRRAPVLARDRLAGRPRRVTRRCRELTGSALASTADLGRSSTTDAIGCAAL